MRNKRFNTLLEHAYFAYEAERGRTGTEREGNYCPPQNLGFSYYRRQGTWDGGFWVVLELSPWVIVSLYSVKFLFIFSI